MGAHFKALDEGVLVEALKWTVNFLPFSIFPKVWCEYTQLLRPESGRDSLQAVPLKLYLPWDVRCTGGSAPQTSQRS